MPVILFSNHMHVPTDLLQEDGVSAFTKMTERNSGGGALSYFKALLKICPQLCINREPLLLSSTLLHITS